jgi:hypothetical protein
LIFASAEGIAETMRTTIVRIVLGICLVFFAGSLSSCARSKGNDPAREKEASGAEEGLSGRWRRANVPADRSEYKAVVDKIASHPYLQAYHKAPSEKGVIIFDSDLAYGGLNFYCSGHAPEASLMDMQGNILHSWTYSHEDVISRIPDFEPWEVNDESKTHWRRAYLYENGDILALFENILLIKLDKDSNLLWVGEVERTHHHMQVREDGGILVLATKKGRMLKRINETRKVIEDSYVELDREGRFVRRRSLLQSFERSPFAAMLEVMPREGELFHTNTIQILDGSLEHVSGVFKQGNILVSALLLNTIAIIDVPTNRVVWAFNGFENKFWNGMHEPVLLDNGNMLVFANHKHGAGVIRESKVLEFDPFTSEIVWQYEGDKDHPFYSTTCGTCQRLPNGNTLITESDNGRAFEVTRAGKIVWEYVSPFRAGDKNELIATLLHMERIDPSTAQWLDRRE